jgi:hypothetical protein
MKLFTSFTLLITAIFCAVILKPAEAGPICGAALSAACFGYYATNVALCAALALPPLQAACAVAASAQLTACLTSAGGVAVLPTP